jgi:hypothetical protein
VAQRFTARGKTLGVGVLKGHGFPSVAEKLRFWVALRFQRSDKKHAFDPGPAGSEAKN